MMRGASQAQSEQASFESLVETCWDALWRYAYRTTGNSHDAEDLLSETLIGGFGSFKQFRGETTFLRWMYRIMTTTRIDMARRAASRKTEALDAPSDDGLRIEPVDSDADPAAILLADILSEPVQKALNALPEEFRAVVVLADMEQIDYADVSLILRIPVGTVRSRLHRGRTLLRSALASYVEKRR